MKTYVMVDVESDGPVPGDFSMTQMGAVVLDNKLDKRFSVNILPLGSKSMKGSIADKNSADAVDAKKAMQKFDMWVEQNVVGKPVFVSDNNGYDWMFVCWYFWHFLNKNPFGYNSTNINSLYKGFSRDFSINIEPLRDRALTHDALEDAVDNAKAWQKIMKLMGDQSQED